MTLIVTFKEEGPPMDPATSQGRIQAFEATLPYLVMTCRVDLPYPASARGIFTVSCDKCGREFEIPATGQMDDPKSLTVSCWMGWNGHHGNA
jgi:hypothetical protein